MTFHIIREDDMPGKKSANFTRCSLVSPGSSHYNG